MIWGEVVEEIRRFHLALAQQVPTLTARPHSPEATLDPSLVPFPAAQDDGDAFDDWDPAPLEGKLGEWIEFHPVERALLEGPLLPIQRIKFTNEAEYARFADAMVGLERAWIQSAARPGEIPAEWETELKSRLLRLQTKAGFRQLRQA